MGFDFPVMFPQSRLLNQGILGLGIDMFISIALDIWIRKTGNSWANLGV